MTANGANMPRCLQRGALFDSAIIGQFYPGVDKGSVHQEVINLNEEQIKIIKLLGLGCEKYYIG